MSAAGTMTNETNTSGRTWAFMSNLIPILTLLVIGYPVAPATIRTMLVGWILMVVAIARSILGDRFQNDRIRRHHKDSARTLGEVPTLPLEVETLEC
jgi:uncharacterized membrane protein